MVVRVQIPLLVNLRFYKMHLCYFLWTDLLLFILGAIGTFLNRRNFIIMLMCIELMLLSTNLLFLSASTLLDDLSGMLMALWVITRAAAETALGLALCVLHVRLRSTLDVELMNLLKGSNKNKFSSFTNFSNL